MVRQEGPAWQLGIHAPFEVPHDLFVGRSFCDDPSLPRTVRHPSTFDEVT